LNIGCIYREERIFQNKGSENNEDEQLIFTQSCYLPIYRNICVTQIYPHS